MHHMADGSLMADDAHPVQEGMGHDEEQLGSGLKDWIKSKATEFKDYWTDPDKDDHHEFFLNLAQQAVDSFDGQKHDWSSLLPTDDSGAGGLHTQRLFISIHAAADNLATFKWCANRSSCCNNWKCQQFLLLQ